MEVNDALVQQLADLARLEFSEQERTEIRGDLQRMITFVEKLNELDTSNVAPLLHLTADYNVFRDDAVHSSVSRAEALKNAPEATDEYFKVPKIIKK
ncbi:aspartyl/glutamyl-tRNA(Asn/Gln) amidotransferase subunit C [Chitinophaga terrae (ex Kim and Jung 2007)]|jgi:aspartyl-tRNA(Asn)/glutamyl-tRNA(Gln) amidotransferase subunit C|uniref:Aspartyl/glutamyl-tRNA(Asn/Gln) amidotransferase subunit C n=1 Tax=Chitinophaga terrae (ex Kim and Jung 2007) TaxID=408074 RepID=A0A1H4A5J0_9BACT|nr:Asp-tRNA(Asn)/Glu-tRNA(Gln) amidotransferase subunit GatC [Chitinophaga terrae (ex Kim and Jung 2007)]MDQ0106017.1 aspartyl-tRNA(Asn)/glutamyl-tRNA(Gln) amidotransferase subunit C [Chitinophaga terrae (ex Kim and Jung 2007)]GEP90058.1 aspartyl/glutamyl-tRNA(Asn/Gln) amidotransferase subunit C [Chitinophaga terrae (ex Kim and Jung 2007)]SEA31226.1 aspartyl/glutamyl-tRNA(Asn/Gln) amidotransferase subunit C [Chitinophaga terrae (ex Kim and Jung 2007)]